MCFVKKVYFTLLLIQIIIVPLFATEYPIRYLGIEDGLSNNAVTSVYQDHKGFMWFGTYDGLNRYDGYKFRIFRNKFGDSTTLVDNGVYTLADDPHHQLWVGARRGVCVFNPATEKFSIPRYQPANGEPAQPVNDNTHIIQSNEDGIILIGTENKGLLQFTGSNATGVQIPLPGRQTAYEVTAIKFVEQGTMAWVFVQHTGLCKYDVATRRLTVISREIAKGNCLTTDAAGNIWVGTDNGVFRYLPSVGKYTSNALPVNSKVVNLYVDNAGVVWCASDGNGIYLISSPDQPGKPLTTPGSPQQLSSNAVYSLYEDRQGRKWVATLRGGINIIEPKRNPFTLVTPNNNSRLTGAADNFVFSFCEDSRQRIWVGTDGGGLKSWDRASNTWTSFKQTSGSPHGISSNFITSIINDGDKGLWLSTWFGGVNHYNAATGTFEHYVCFNPYTRAAENNVWLVYQDRQSTLWASTTNNGTMYRFNRPEQRFELFDSSLVNMQCLEEDKAGNLWGGNYSSVILIDRLHLQHKRFYVGYTIRSLHEDGKNRFWVGTDGGGLLLFNRQTGQFSRFTTSEGLPSNSILRILEDSHGNLWLSTFNGLCRFDPEKKSFRNFSASDGLQSNQFSFNAALKLQSGEFLFGGIRGFNMFFPDSVITQSPVPPVWLVAVKVNNTPITELGKYVTTRNRDEIEEITVPYDKATIAIDFVGLEYTSPDKINYAYRLKGWDNNWINAGQTRTANYTHLREGNYVFEVRASNADGVWGPDQQTISITVLPPWYRTWWAYLLYVGSTIAAIYLYISYRTREEKLKYEIRLAHLEKEKEKELNEKKLAFFTNVSHEFRTPLTLIINPLKALIQQKDNDELGIVYRNARRLLSLVDQLLLFRKADQEGDQLKVSRLDLVHLCQEVFQCFSQLAKSKHIDYQFRCGAEELELYGDSEKLEIILFNLLSNAFKFTPDNGNIILEVTEADDTVAITIKDSGPGISGNIGNRIFEKFSRARDQKDSLQTGFGIGLYLVKHFTEKHHGHITYRSEVNQGTAFIITLKKGSAHFRGMELHEEAPPKSNFLEELAPSVENPVLPSPAKDAELPTTTITEKKSILLIDDHDEIRQYLKQLFHDKFIVYEASDGNAGFAAVQKLMPDLVISDIQMDGMDGMELCNRIKQTDTVSHIPVILLTGSSAQDTRIKGLEGGADDYITKPFDKDFLMAKVNNIIKNRNRLQQYFFDNITLKNSNIKVPAEYQDFLKRCIEIIENNLDDETFSIKKFTMEIGMSHSSLYKKVKSISGQTINSFIRSIRLRKAAVLLLKENCTITQAAMQVGIGDIKYFREQFVKLFGMNPSDYVKKYRHSFNRDFNVTENQ
ncbi:signal transduction histidine kinase/ligand-binding sensor domain-containing protein/DNA-binding response OmpR family regulator [Chitinophaga terrae (ex Kim and Jung 2007)]|uniref:hybrid sensor histidine kinase/response regulator transcription factor n=1 Tax=Chitinophaga terrae (ex Kim and Jung 2007) TaxID=408074 RepID=UPI00277DAE8A|nr:two-component regulator propeller domain-containing protein [Chitinophaga terrae (ex Kim and Jung 2007)]MDQ0106962.1 signal transduction histidine kinase/ligand-binding sensor domain-containing protein/DNA-binding response OmpR family regulator [Chitinophaga terrae (ex Kim and Jung 2007)]